MSVTSGNSGRFNVELAHHNHEYDESYQVTFASRNPIFEQYDPQAAGNNNAWVSQSIPSVPSDSTNIIMSVLAQADESHIYLDVSGEGVMSQREMTRAFASNNSDDAAANWNTFICPYKSSYYFRYRASGDSTPGQNIDFVGAYVDGYIQTLNETPSTGLSANVVDNNDYLAASSRVSGIAEPNTTSMSTSIWVKPASLGGVGNDSFIWSAYSTNNLDPSWPLPDSNGWYVKINTSQLIYESGPNQKTVSQVFNTTQWYNIVTVHSGTNAAFYVDGSLIGEGSNNPGDAYDSVGPIQTGWGTLLSIGRPARHSTNFGRGLYDEAALFNTALTPTQVSSIYNAGIPADISSQNPISYWKMGNGIGDTTISGSFAYEGKEIGTIIDQGSDPHSLTGGGGIIYGTGYKALNPRQSLAVDFDGINDGLDCGDDSSLEPTNISVSAWVKTEGTLDGYNNVFVKLGAAFLHMTFAVRYRSTNRFNLYVAYNGGGYSSNDSSSTFTLTDWNHVVFTYDKTNLKLYVNGSEEFTVAETRDINYTDEGDGTSFRIGKGIQPDPAEGLIDDVSYFNYALSASQVSTMYADGASADISSLNPISWWKMGNGLGGTDLAGGAPQIGDTVGTIVDQGSASNNATGLGDPTYGAGQDFVAPVPASPPYSNELSADLDGINDYLDIGSSGDMGSFSLWFKPDSTITTSTTAQYLLSFSANGSIYGNLGLGSSTSSFANEVLTFNQGNRAYGYAGAGFTISAEWHHVAGRWTGSTYEVYLDGVQVKNEEGGGGTAGQVAFSALKIGGRGASENYAGLIDEVAVFTNPLSAAEIVAIYNSGLPADLTSYSPVGWWRMGDGKGDSTSGGLYPANSDTIGTVVDQGSGGNDATAAGGPTYSNVVPTFASTLSANFDGTDDYLAVPFAPSSIGTNAYSISFWFNITSGATEDSPYFFAFGANSSITTDTFQGLGLTARSGDGYKVRINNSFSTSYTQSVSSSTSDVAAGNWYHFVLVRDGTSLTLYKNGSSFLTLTNANVGSNDLSDGSELRLGYGYGASARYINGFIDEFAIFNSALSASDVTAIYNSGVPADLASYSPLGWWRMGENNSGSNGATIGTVTDEGSGGNNATGEGPIYSNFVSPTFSRLSANFDGINDYLGVTPSSTIDLYGLSAWFKCDTVIDKDAVKGVVLGPAALNWFIGFGGNVASALTDEIISINVGAIYGYCDASASISTDWHHVAVAWSTSSATNGGGDGYDIWLDGVKVGNQANTDFGAATLYTIPASAIRFGQRADGNYPFAGLLDEIAIFSSTLSASDIATLYNAGIPGDLTSLNPAGWWRMGENNDGSNGAAIGTVTDEGSEGNDGTGSGATYSNSVAT